MVQMPVNWPMMVMITPIGNESYSYVSTHANGQEGADLVYILKNKAGLTANV